MSNDLTPQPLGYPYEPPDPDRPASASPSEEVLEAGSAPLAHDPYGALRFPSARRFLLGDLSSNFGTQMLSVAIGWELYSRTGSATALGLVGLVQAIPIIFFALPAGQIVDTFHRKYIVMVSQALLAACSLALAAASFFYSSIPNWPVLRDSNELLLRLDLGLQSLFHQHFASRFDEPVIPLIYLILFGNGMVRSFNAPARNSLLPQLVPHHLVSNAITWGSSSFQIAAVLGPAVGGFLAALSFPLVYALDACGHCFLIFFLMGIAAPEPAKSKEKPNVAMLLAGIRFVVEKKVILATITLDLFAVLLGGAVALLPIYADLLHVGPIGLGFMRAAPSVGALLMGLHLAHRRPMEHAGTALLWAVAGFGVATVIFGLTAWLPNRLLPNLGFALALIMLFFTGALDNISVVVRHSLVQILTPDAMRGRVSAVNNVFIGSSNELGAFESGIAAAMFGPVLSVIGGGVGTVLVVVAIAFIWPQIRQIRRLHDAAAPQ